MISVISTTSEWLVDVMRESAYEPYQILGRNTVTQKYHNIILQIIAGNLHRAIMINGHLTLGKDENLKYGIYDGPFADHSVILCDSRSQVLRLQEIM